MRILNYEVSFSSSWNPRKWTFAKKAPEEIKVDKNKPMPPSRSSAEPQQTWGNWEDKTLVKPGYQFEIIPQIRQLSINNSSLSQALSNIVNLGNTGHKVEFDSSVDPAMIDKMRNHLDSVTDSWAYGTAGITGLTNKMFSQVMIAGAISVESVPKMDFSGVKQVILVDPTTVRFKYDNRKQIYLPYQVVSNPSVGHQNSIDGLKPLNVNTYKYYALNGDTELPYGNPPYLPSICHLEDQSIMLKNIKFIIRNIGIMGFMEMLVDKPEQRDGESDGSYDSRLTQFLNECKANVESSLMDGIIVGYQGDHEFKFQTATKSAQGVKDLFEQNEAQVYAGLKMDPALAGKNFGSTESMISVIFNKLLAELTNIQLIVARTLEHIYYMELIMAGYKIKKLKVVFNPSTILDDLKMQQAREIKIRNLDSLYRAGIISQERYADEMGYDRPDKSEPRVALEDKDLADEAQKKQEREKKKDESDKKVRDKNKPR